MKDFKIYSEFLTQYKELTCKEEKLFYYAYAKFYIKVLAVMKKQNIDDVEEFDFQDFTDYEVNVDYDEIKILSNVKRVDRYNFKDVENNLIKDCSSIKIIDENNNIKIVFLYESICFDNDKRKVRIVFNQYVKKILLFTRDRKYTKILIEDMKNINKNYDFKLYLYCLTIMREKKSSGIIRMKLSELREIINPNSTIPDNNFYSRFLNEPMKRINNNDNLSIKINIKREKDVILINVFERKNKED